MTNTKRQQKPRRGTRLKPINIYNYEEKEQSKKNDNLNKEVRGVIMFGLHSFIVVGECMLMSVQVFCRFEG